MKNKFISIIKLNSGTEIYAPGSIKIPEGEIPLLYHGIEIGKAILTRDEKSGIVIAKGVIDEEE